MEKLYKSTKTRSIGVSNWTVRGLQALLEYADVKPVINQVEIHPFLPNNELIKYCFSQDILPAAYSPLGSQNQTGSTRETISSNKALNKLAKEKGVTLAQVLIAWGLKRGYVVLPKSADAVRIKSNFHVIDLTEEDFEAINQVAKGRHDRFVNPEQFGHDVWAEESS